MKETISGKDYDRAAARLGCLPAAVEAVAVVESSGAGFNPDESPKTLFEGHVFHRLTKGRYDAISPTLSYPKWTREFYGRTWQDEQFRLEQAKALDRTAALMSASWGKFQIMGFNFGACGFTSVDEFAEAMAVDERRHLEAFIGFIESYGLADEMRDRRWAEFARTYNGPDYAVNHYDEKLEKAFKLAMHNRGLEA